MQHHTASSYIKQDKKYQSANNIPSLIFSDNVDIRYYITFDTTLNEWKLVAENPYDFRNILDAFSVPNPKAFFSNVHGYNVDKNLYLVNKFGFFPLGMLFEVLEFIKKEHGSIKCVKFSDDAKIIIAKYLLPLKKFVTDNNLTKESFEISNISYERAKSEKDKKKFVLRDYQYEAIKSIIFNGYGRGMIELPTASGKSFVIANFIWTLLQQYDEKITSLILVPSKQLVEQFYKDLLDYGYRKSEIAKLTGGIDRHKVNRKAKIFIANRQFLFTNQDLLPDKIDAFVVDECHQIAPDSSSYSLIEKINAKILVGFSGTIPRDKYHRLTLIGLFSRIFYSEDIVKLQRQGYLTKLNITLLHVIDTIVEKNRNYLFHTNSNIRYNENSTDVAFNAAYKAELEYTATNYERLYTPAINYIKDNFKGNTLILFDRIEFGKGIYELAREILLKDDFNDQPDMPKYNLHYIDGSIKVSDREYVRDIFEKTNNNILFAEVAVMSTGVNIKNLPNIVFMFSGKSLSRVIQSIGRTLRLHINKKMSNVLDLTFNFKYSKKHLAERFKIYKEFYNKSKPDKIVRIQV